MRRPSLSVLGLVLGVGAWLSVGGMVVYDSVLRDRTDELPRQAKLDQLWWAGIALAAAAVLLVVLAFLLRKDRRFRVLPAAIPAVAFLLYGLLPLYLKRMPSLSETELSGVRDRAMPLIEEVTGLRFRETPEITFGSVEEYAERERREREQSGMEDVPVFLLLGLYRQESRAITIFPDGLDRVRADWGLYAGETRDFAHLTVVHELVHALDHQYGHLKTEEEKRQLAEWNLVEFLIQRALEEGHARWVAAEVGSRLGLDDPHEVRRGFRTEENRPDPVMEDFYGPVIRFMYEEGSRFIGAVHRRGGPEAVGEAFEHPPLWLYHVRKPETYLADRESGDYELMMQALESLVEYLPTEDWVPYTGAAFLNETLDPIFASPAAEEEGFVGEVSGVFGRSKDGKMDLKGPLGGLWLFRFRSPGGAKSYLEVERRGAREDLEEGGRLTEDRLKGGSIGGTYRYKLFYPPTDEEEASTAFKFLAQRGIYVLRFTLGRLEDPEQATDLWTSIVASTLDVLEAKPE